MNSELIKSLAPHCTDDNARIFADTINAKAEQYGITTPLRLAHFLAQTCHESAGFTTFKENLNYSLKELRSVFPKYFKTDTIAAQYAHKPVAIGNRVYAQRLGNGTEASGDGYRYRGRGCIQITGKAQYKDVKRHFGVDVISNPDLLAEPFLAMGSAMWWWNSHSCNALADKDDIIMLTRRINGGTNGLPDRIEKTKKAKSLLI